MCGVGEYRLSWGWGQALCEWCSVIFQGDVPLGYCMKIFQRALVNVEQATMTRESAPQPILVQMFQESTYA